MGRKSSAKQPQNRVAPTAGGSAPTPPSSASASRSSTLGPILAAVVLVSVVAFIAYSRSSGSQASGPPAIEPAPAPAPQQTATTTPVLGPHPQANLPPLPMVPAPPARPIETVREVYAFAAEHPEVLSYVPCYCGCERSGHRGNEDCFVTRRDSNGDVSEWEPHGVT